MENNKDQLLQRYAKARLVLDLRNQYNAETAAIATKFAVADLVGLFDRYVKSHGDEYAIQMLQAHVEDVEDLASKYAKHQ